MSILTTRHLVIVFALLPWVYYTPYLSGFQLRTDLAQLLLFLFVLIGASRAPLLPVQRSLVMAVCFGFGFLLASNLGYIPKGDVGAVGFILNNGADLVGGFLVLAGARRFATAGDSTGRSETRQDPPSFGVAPALIAVLAGLAFLNSTVFYVAFAWSKQGSVGLSLFYFAHACLFSLAFGMTLPKRWWIVALIAAAVSAAALVGPIRPSSLGLQLGIRPMDILNVLCNAATAAAYARMGAVIASRGWRPSQDARDPRNFSTVLGVVRQEARRIISAGIVAVMVLLMAVSVA